MSADQTAVNRPTLSPYAQWELAFVYAFVSVFGAVEKEHRDLVAFPDLQPEVMFECVLGYARPITKTLSTPRF